MIPDRVAKTRIRICVQLVNSQCVLFKILRGSICFCLSSKTPRWYGILSLFRPQTGILDFITSLFNMNSGCTCEMRSYTEYTPDAVVIRRVCTYYLLYL